MIYAIATVIYQIGLYKYTEAELKQLLKTLTVIVDTREKENDHITGYFSQKNIPYISQALSFGDYSYMLPACPELGITRDMYFHNDYSHRAEYVSDNEAKDGE